MTLSNKGLIWLMLGTIVAMAVASIVVAFAPFIVAIAGIVLLVRAANQKGCSSGANEPENITVKAKATRRETPAVELLKMVEPLPPFRH